jgi:hypothetical protein
MLALMPRLTMATLGGLPGLRLRAKMALLTRQPATVRQALAIPDVGKGTTLRLFEAGLLADPEGLMDDVKRDGERSDPADRPTRPRRRTGRA